MFGEEGTALQRRPHHLVGVPRQRVGPAKKTTMQKQRLRVQSDIATHRSMPFIKCWCVLDSLTLPPQQQSTCSHNLCFSHTSAMSLRGSNAPSTVVPDVATTRNGCLPCDRRSTFSESNAIQEAHASRAHLGLSCEYFRLQVLHVHLSVLVRFDKYQVVDANAHETGTFLQAVVTLQEISKNIEEVLMLE